MRVVHLIKVKGVAGAERHLLDLLHGLRQRGVDAQFLLLVPPDNPVDEMVQEAESLGIPTHRLVIQRHADFALIGSLRDKLRELKPDILHTHLIHADLYGVIAGRLAGVRHFISSRHNDDAFRLKTPLKFINNLLWRNFDAGIAISEAVRRFSIEVEGVPPAKIHTIYYGLPLPVPQVEKPTARRALRREIIASDDTPIMGMVCRLIGQKGIPDAIEAFARIKDDFPTARLVIVGEGVMRGELEAQITYLKLENRVHLLGWRTDRVQIMAGLDIFLMPSHYEGFGLVMIEAMSQAIPIIGSTASAIPEVVVNGQTGLTIPPRDPAALAVAMRTLLTDKPLRMHMGLLGQERLETHFSADKMIDETLALYRHLIGQT